MERARVVSVITQAGEGGIEVVSGVNYPATVLPLNDAKRAGIRSTQFGILLQIPRVAAILRQADIVLTNLPMHHMVFWLVNKLYQKRHIAVEHGPWLIVIGHKSTIFLSFVYQAWLKGAQLPLVTVSKDLYSLYNLLRANNHYIPNRLVTPALTRSGCPPSGHVKVVFVGRFDYQKDVHLLVASFLEFSRTTPDSSLDMFGSGRELASLQEACAEFQNIAFRGYTPNVRDLLHEYDVCLITSRFEGLPGVALEALYAGCRVVAAPFLTGLLELASFPNLVIAEDRSAAAIAKAVAHATTVSFDASSVRERLRDEYGERVTFAYDRLIHPD